MKFMIVVDFSRIGRCAKGEKISPAAPRRRLIIEWTAQL
jgi:hypothetical protein